MILLSSGANPLDKIGNLADNGLNNQRPAAVAGGRPFQLVR